MTVRATKNANKGGFTLIEVIVVVALIAFIYMIAVPQFSARTGAEAATRVTRLADDIRSAYDMAVLNNRVHRMVFTPATGQYFLEVAESDVKLPAPKGGHDPTEEEAKAVQEEFAAKTKEYESLGAEKVKDEEGKEIPGSNLSPILKNRAAAAPTKWKKVENMEWTDRSLGYYLMISEMQAAHHAERQVLGDLGPKGRAFIYFFPQGYVEKAYIRVAFKKDDMVVDEDQKPYTIITKPFLGTADVVTGTQEIDVHDLTGEDNQT